MIQRLERFVYYALIFSIIFQFGKHFWPKFSFVQGIRVDYLSPTLYIHDILISLLFLLVIFNKREDLLSFLKNKLFLSSIVVLVLSSIFVSVPSAAFFGIIKFIEFAFLAFYSAYFFKKSQLRMFLRILLVCSFCVSVIAILQFTFQHSLGGIFYYLGERTFNASTIGIAVFHHSGVSVLRPYATFPHPNVLAFYLLFSFVFLLFNQKQVGLKKPFLYLFLLVLVLALLATFSRLTIFLGFLIVLYFLSHNFYKKKKAILATLAIIFMCLFLFVSERFSLSSLLKDLSYRNDLLFISWNIFLKHAFFGVGIFNFFIHEIAYQKSVTPTLLQPVHNIYMYVLTSTGIVGFVFFIYLLKKTLLRIIKQKKSATVENKSFYLSIKILFLSVLVIGFFDHFFLTVQQGELLFALILGLSYSKINAQE